MLLTAAVFIAPSAAFASSPAACRVGVIEGEIKAGQAFTQVIGNGLSVFLEPLPSGWILRIVPSAGPRGDHDYAELATPPYHSVSPLLISTDFAFRSQDAVGWNPRHFHFATAASSFAGLREAYKPYEDPAAKPTGAQEAALGERLAETSRGLFQILDARLIPGTADQWKMAAAVASHFTTTAHTLDLPADGKPTPLGKLTWLRFRISLELPPPASFPAGQGLRIESRGCAAL